MKCPTARKILVDSMDRVCEGVLVYQQHDLSNLRCQRGEYMTRTLQTSLLETYASRVWQLSSCACCNRASDFGLGVSDEQADQVELTRPPSMADFQGFPDAPALHRLRQVSGLRVTDDTDPSRIPTNTGRSAGNLAVPWV